MDFFQAQDHARTQSRRLVLLFALAVAGIITAIYVTLLLLGASQGVNTHRPDLFILVAVVTLAVIGIASAVRTARLRQGGRVVAEMLGGTAVTSSTMDEAERRYVNVVEEMALAAGVPVPGIYILPEAGINAFAAGYTVDDAVVAVTRGALEQLNREELQGVVAHEFSHILNGDMRLNIRLMGLLFGILVIAIVGRVMMYGGGRRRGKNEGAIALFALALFVIGYIGVFFGRMIQAAVSRQREFLADASAVQFTRDPNGIAGALKKIGGWPDGARLKDPHAAEAGHMFFASGLNRAWMSALATHPPLEERIRRIDPAFAGAGAARTVASPRSAAAAGLHDGASVTDVMASVGALRPQDIAAAASLIDSLPAPVRAAAHDTDGAQALLFAILLADGPVDTSQRAAAERHAGAAAWSRIDGLRSHVVALDASVRQPLVELLLPALRPLDAARKQALVAAAHEVAVADGHTSTFEHAVLHVLQRQLTPAGNASAQSRVRSTRPDRLRPEVETLLSAVAWAGADSPAAAATAFAAGATALRAVMTSLALRPQAEVDAATEPALAALRAAAPAVKRAFLEAAATTAAEDGVVHPQEMQLIRAIAEAIECPLPLASAGVPLAR
ncbi:MAG TPA: M48 family metallopeptidase [Longimicrobiales bacterium]|nr:M48 family metallopeptidase [Longimicrobiales bacterium]